jgi:hypothetical protein
MKVWPTPHVTGGKNRLKGNYTFAVGFLDTAQIIFFRAAGFADDFANAAETAQFVTITTSPQTYTFNLAEAQRDGRGPRGPRNNGSDFDDFQNDFNQNAPVQSTPDETNS